MKLYTYFRSSAAYRVRIALNLKGLSYQAASIHLTKDGGKQFSAVYRAINPQMRVPALALSSGDILTQSLAIIEYLDEVFPEPSLLPPDAIERAHVRALSQIFVCDIHPLNNLAVFNYLRGPLKQDKAAIEAWFAHWVLAGMEAVEAKILAAPYACGSQVTMADLCIVPQVYSARRLNVPLERFPKIVAVDAACSKLAAFEKAVPEKQPDAE